MEGELQSARAGWCAQGESAQSRSAPLRDPGCKQTWIGARPMNSAICAGLRSGGTFTHVRRASPAIQDGRGFAMSRRVRLMLMTAGFGVAGTAFATSASVFAGLNALAGQSGTVAVTQASQQAPTAAAPCPCPAPAQPSTTLQKPPQPVESGQSAAPAEPCPPAASVQPAAPAPAAQAAPSAVAPPPAAPSQPSTPAVQPRTLPRTASPYPLFGLLGLFSLVAAGTLRIFRRRITSMLPVT
jgi:hypothetical protein